MAVFVPRSAAACVPWPCAQAKQNEELQEEVRLLRVQLTQVLQEKGPAASAKSRNPVLATLVQAQNIGAPAHATTGTVRMHSYFPAGCGFHLTASVPPAFACFAVPGHAPFARGSAP